MTAVMEAYEGELVGEALDERVGVLAAQLHALSAELVDTIAELSASGGHLAGFSSAAQWLSVRAGFTPTEARRLCGLADRVEELPTLMGHARAGRLSAGVVAMAARVVDADNEAAVADVATTCTPAQAARVLSSFRSVADAEDRAGRDGDRVPDPVSWWRSWTDESGRGRIDAALSAEVAALVEEAWAAATAAGEVDPDPTQRPTADEVASRWATTMLDHAHDEGICRAGGDRHGVLVNIDVATLARVLGLDVDPALPIGLGTQAFDARTGRHLADHEVARFCCDAGIQVLVHHRGVPLWMSQVRRTASRHQRRALHFRASGTGGCEYPGCTQTRYLDAHHVVFHRDDGSTSLDNLLLLCGHHHRALHRGDFSVDTGGDQIFTFTDRWGQHLGTSSTSQRPGGPGPHLTRLPHLEHPPDPPPHLHGETPRPLGGGEPLTRFGLDVYLSQLLSA